MLSYARIQKKVQQMEHDLRGWRQELHALPEQGLELPQTHIYLHKLLAEWGLPVDAGYAGGFGIISKVQGKKSGAGRVFALRADMDALPVREQTELPFASKHEGYMHACGHDAHMAIALGAASVLHDLREEWDGEVRLIFQPGEEGPGGARLMVQEGALDGVDGALALHVDPLLPLGAAYFKEGQINSYVDFFFVTLEGRGGHGAYPHQAVDPVLAAAGYITALQQLVSRNSNPQEATVVTVGKIAAGEAPNVIPSKAELAGSCRCYQHDTRSLFLRRLREIGEGIALQHGICHQLRLQEGYPPVYNHPQLTRFCKEQLQDILGNELVQDLKVPLTGSDDFSYISAKVPSTLFRLGCAFPEKDDFYPLHSSRFNLPDEVLTQGCSYISYLLLSLLSDYR